jgi:hypothetical protein
MDANILKRRRKVCKQAAGVVFLPAALCVIWSRGKRLDAATAAKQNFIM